VAIDYTNILPPADLEKQAGTPDLPIV